MIKGVIVGLIWGIVTISVVVVAFGIGNPPNPQLAQPVPEAIVPAVPVPDVPQIAVATPEPEITKAPEPALPVVVAEPAPEVTPPAISATEQVASLSPPAGSAFTDERPDFTPSVPRTDTAPMTAITPTAQEPAAEAPTAPVVAQSAEPPVIAQTPSSPAAPDAADEAQASLGSADVQPPPMTSQVSAQPATPVEDAGLPIAATEPAKEPVQITAGPEIGTVPPVPAQPGSGEFAPEIAALPAPAALPQVQNAVTLQTQDSPDATPETSETRDAVITQTVPTERMMPKRLEIGAGRAPVVEVGGSEVSEPPKTGFRRVVPGVRTDRLPRIESTPEIASEPAGEATSTEGETALEPVPTPVLPGQARAGAQAADAEPGALARNAIPFTNEPALPLIAVVLTPGDGGVDAESIKGLPFPVTVALDPNAPDAAATAETYRRAGAEVLILPAGLPKGASASDIEVSFATFFAEIPTAVGVIDLPTDGFAANMLGAKQVAAILAADGYGMITYGRGLNSATQEAARLSVPAAEVLRVLDEGGVGESALRRNLDRAAFDAAQAGGTIVVAKASPETLTTLSDWVQDAGTVRLAPVSAVLTAD